MKKSKVHKYAFVLVIFCLLCLYAAAQQSFRYKAMLDTVQQDGFYKIMLPPAIVAECQPHLADIRIKNDEEREVPYILKQQTTAFVATNVLPFPLLTTNRSGKIILQNSSGTGTDELVLFIKNTAAYRTVTLSGSDDTSHWFVIKENIVLAKDDNKNDETSFSQVIQFPYSNYRYFQVNMQGKDSLPLNIFKGGIYRKTSITNNSFDVIPKPAIIQRDSGDKKSYIKLQFDKSYQIDKLQFSLSGAKFFNRSFTVYNNASNDFTVIASGIATSGDSSITLSLQVKTNALLLVVNNLDNAPLTFKSAVAYQLPVTLIAYMDAGKSYHLVYGNSSLAAPAYDLQYFGDSVHTNISTLAVKKIEKINAPVQTKATGNHLSTWLLWSIIIAVLLLLIYFSYTLLKDINRKTTNTDAHL